MDKKELDLCLQEIAKGDNRAFERLYEETRKGIFAYLYGFSKDYHKTEDLMQTVYLKVKANITKYRAGSDARAWLFQVAKYTALNDIRKTQREPVASEIQQQRYAQQEYELQDSPVFEAMQKILSEEERQIMILHILWGFKHKEIAEMLDMALGTTLWKYNRAIKKLQQNLKEERL